ncbi:hypothetical protein ACER0C_027057 [Sarotherodon galilaeus]
MDRGDGPRSKCVIGVPADELVFELLQCPDFEEIHPMVRWLQMGLLRSLLTEENLHVLGQVIHQLQQHDDEEDNLQNDEEEADEEEADVPAAGIGITKDPGYGTLRQQEINPAQQTEDPIAEEMRWFWDNEEAESDSDSVPESGPDSDTDHSDTDNNDSDDDGDNGQDAPVLLPPSPVPGGSRKTPSEEEENDEEGRTATCSPDCHVPPVDICSACDPL